MFSVLCSIPLEPLPEGSVHTKPLQECMHCALGMAPFSRKCPHNRGTEQPNCVKGKTAVLVRIKGDLHFYVAHAAHQDRHTHVVPGAAAALCVWVLMFLGVHACTSRGHADFIKWGHVLINESQKQVGIYLHLCHAQTKCSFSCAETAPSNRLGLSETGRKWGGTKHMFEIT